MDDRHQPRPDFVDNLEWQVRTALRRRSRFAEPTRRNGGTMKLASVVLVSALIGAGGVVVSEEVQQSRQQEILVERVQTEMRLAELQVAMAQSQLEQIEERAGLVGEETLLSARMAHREAAVLLQTLALDLEEIRGAGREPHNGVDAPLVDGRDFVRERIQLRLSVHEQHLQLAEMRLAKLRELQAAYSIPDQEARQGVMALDEARIQLESLLQRLQIRDRFQEGELTAEEAVREAEILGATSDLRIQEMASDLASLRLQRLEEQAELGLIHQSEVERARLEVMQMALAQELVLLRLRELGGGVGGG